MIFPLERKLSWFLLFAFASGALAHTLPAVLPVTRLTTDGLLLVINGLLIYSIYQRHHDRKLLVWLALAYCFTFAAEAIGVATGALFGEYAYGETMWWQWLGVPFVIALNWCMLTLAANEFVLFVAEKLRPNTELPRSMARSSTEAVTIAVLASVILALYDVAIEPVAIKLDYWQWGGGVIPLRNYLMWAIVAFIISLPLQLLGIRFRSPLLLVYLFAQLFFFLVLNLVL